MKYFFKAVSYILHPILMPMLAFYLLFEFRTIPDSLLQLDSLFYFQDGVKQAIYLVMGILTLLAPGLSLLIMYWNKMISDLELSNRKERFYPYGLIIFYYALAFGYLKLRLPDIFQHPALMAFIFGIILVFLVSFFLNFYIKVSMHAAGIFGVAGAMLAYYQTQIESNIAVVLALLFAGGIVAASRVYLGAHTLKETFVGMAVGFGVIYISVRFGIYI